MKKYILCVLAFVGFYASFFSFMIHLEMVKGDWNFPLSNYEIILTGIGALIFLLAFIGTFITFIILLIRSKNKWDNEEVEDDDIFE